MIDGLIKHVLDPLWEAAATPLVKARVTPNQVTIAGLILIGLSSAAFLWHRNTALFGATLALAFAFDALDGAVARRRGLQSKAGGYLDAMVDRYQELCVLAALALVHEVWAWALAVFSGAMITSYAKARTALEAPVSNDGWPDLMERLERIIYLCALLLLVGALSAFGLPERAMIIAGLAILALLVHATALQRFMRAYRLLAQEDASARPRVSDTPERLGHVEHVGEIKDQE